MLRLKRKYAYLAQNLRSIKVNYDIRATVLTRVMKQFERNDGFKWNVNTIVRRNYQLQLNRITTDNYPSTRMICDVNTCLNDNLFILT